MGKKRPTGRHYAQRFGPFRESGFRLKYLATAFVFVTFSAWFDGIDFASVSHAGFRRTLPARIVTAVVRKDRQLQKNVKATSRKIPRGLLSATFYGIIISTNLPVRGKTVGQNSPPLVAEPGFLWTRMHIKQLFHRKWGADGNATVHWLCFLGHRQQQAY